jgi:Ni/Fe-hydrogenase subunit HybB-like protein
VFTLIIPMRRLLKLEAYITPDHFDKLAKILLLTSLIVSFSYAVEWGMSAYGHSVFERAISMYRLAGDYKVLYWIMLLCNVVLPLSLFARRLRRNVVFLFVLSLCINVGMWLERFVIIVTSLAHDFLPYNWGTYKPRWVEVCITLGSFGMFFTFFLLFVKLLPVLSITEIKERETP